jgi:hypothetical protein
LISLEQFRIELQGCLALLRFRYKFLDSVPQHIQIDRFRDVIARAATNRFNCRFGGILAGDQNHFCLRRGVNNTIENLQPVHARHHEIQQYNLRAPLQNRFQACFRISVAEDLDRVLFERGPNEIEAAFVVIDRGYRDKMRSHNVLPSGSGVEQCLNLLS